MNADEIRTAVEQAEVEYDGRLLLTFTGLNYGTVTVEPNGDVDGLMGTDLPVEDVADDCRNRARPIFAAIDLLSPKKGWVFHITGTGTQGVFVRTHTRTFSFYVWQDADGITSRGAMPQHREAGELLLRTFGLEKLAKRYAAVYPRGRP